MGKKINQAQRDNEERARSVIQLLRKHARLTLKQEKFCNNTCVERFLKAKGENVKKATKALISCLAWRDSIGTENLMADEFSAEIAEGAAYVAGHDDESRPVLIFRIKQEYHKFHSQKMFTRLLVFTLEVAIQTMSKNVEQFVLIFDASFFRSASAFMNMLTAILKILADYYPCRVYKTFIIDPPSLFSYLWKLGMKPFVELSSLTSIVSSLDFEEPHKDFITHYHPRASSLRFDASKIGPCSSSRFAFTVSQHFDAQAKPWYLSFTDTSASKMGPASSSRPFSGPAISPLDARSFSFDNVVRKGFFPSTPMPQKTQKLDPSVNVVRRAKTPKPSYFPQSPALSLFKRSELQASRVEKSRDMFSAYLKFYRRSYDDMVYRSKMRPPLSGLISIVSPQIRRQHVSISQRF